MLSSRGVEAVVVVRRVEAVVVGQRMRRGEASMPALSCYML